MVPQRSRMPRCVCDIYTYLPTWHARFSATPSPSRKVGCSDRHAPRAAGEAYRPSSPSRAAFIVRQWWNHSARTLMLVTLPNDCHQTQRNARLNATKYLFCCVRHFIASIQRSSPHPNRILISGGVLSSPGGAR